MLILKKGFTLIEITIVIAIFLLLSLFWVNNLKTTSDEEYINRYAVSVQKRINELYSKVILNKWLNEDILYLKLVCKEDDPVNTQKNFFAYECSETSCKQIFFPISWYGWDKFDQSEQKKWYLNSCYYYQNAVKTAGTYYVYIQTAFPYTVYKKIIDDGVFNDEWIGDLGYKVLYGAKEKDYIFNIK